MMNMEAEYKLTNYPKLYALPFEFKKFPDNFLCVGTQHILLHSWCNNPY